MNRRQVFAAMLILALPAFAAESDDQHRAAATLKRMDALAQAIETYIAQAHATPATLSPAVANGTPLNDEWGTPFRFVKTGDHAYEIISAGADRQFAESTWTTKSGMTDFAADAVYAKGGAATAGTFRRVWLNALGAPLGSSTEETNAWAQIQGRTELEAVQGMSEEESLSVMRSRGTMREMFALAVLIERYKLKNGAYPPAKSMNELAGELLPDTASDVKKSDWWGTDFRYQVSPDQKSYRLVSAGNDRTFDPASWDRPGPLPTTDDDAVIRNGEWVRKWDEKTRRGLTVEERRRLTLKPDARALLEKADAFLKTDDHKGALTAYMDAVKIDPAAANLDFLDRIGVNTSEEVQGLHAAALRQYLQIHPDDWKATESLLILVPLEEAESLLVPFLKAKPNDPELYAMRATVRAKHGKFEESFADYLKAQELDPKNPERYYIAGVVAYERVAKDPKLAEPQKRTLIRKGLDLLEKAESLKPGYFEAITYRSLLIRQQAMLEKDPEKQKQLIAEADAVRERAVEIIKKRKTAVAQHP